MLQGIKDILVGVTKDDGNEDDSSTLAYGLSLAAQASASITVQSASVHLSLHSTWVSEFAAGLISEENKRRKTLAEALAVEARRGSAAAGLSCMTYAPHLEYAELLDSFALNARLHDLTVYAGDPQPLGQGRGVVERLLTESGRPLIIVPRGLDAFRCRRVVIAWDGSDKAARAANDALPFLRAADAVEIVTVEGEKNIAECGMGAKFAPHLARHGIEASVDCLGIADGDVAETLRSAARRFGADLIVMGGYVHTRTRELFFGGVTQSLLKNSAWPLFMSH